MTITDRIIRTAIQWVEFGGDDNGTYTWAASGGFMVRHHQPSGETWIIGPDDSIHTGLSSVYDARQTVQRYVDNKAKEDN